MNPIVLTKALLFKNTPVYVHYGITHRCNLQCGICSLWKNSNNQEELSTEEIEKMAKVLKKLGVQAISIGGGEPLVREDLPEAVSFFINQGISARILTNGVVDYPLRLEALIDAGVCNFSVSLDSMDQGTQNGIVGRNDAFDRIVDTVKRLAPVVKKRGGVGLVNTVVSAVNIDALKPVVEFAKKHGFYVSFVPLETRHFSHDVSGCSIKQGSFAFKESDWEKINRAFEMLVEMKSDGQPIFNSSRFLKDAARYLCGETPTWECLAGRLYFSISPGGYFSICHKYEGFCGKMHILSDEFHRYFGSKRFMDDIAEMAGNCRDCLRPCWIEVSNAFTRWDSMYEMFRLYLGKQHRFFK